MADDTFFPDAPFLFKGQLGVDPSTISALKRIHFRKTQFLQLMCHPGTGGFSRSRSVQNECLVLFILMRPRLYIFRLLTHSARQFVETFLVLFAQTHIDDNGG